MKNMRVSTKLTLGFCTVIILSIILSAVAMWTILSINTGYTHLHEYPQQRYDALLRIRISFAEVKHSLALVGMISGLDEAESSIKSQMDLIEHSIEDIKAELDYYINSVGSDSKYTQEEKTARISEANRIKGLIDKWYAEIALSVAQAGLDGHRQEVADLAFHPSVISLEAFDAIDNLLNKTRDYVETVSAIATETVRRSEIILITVSIAIMIISAGFAIRISLGIVRPLADLTHFMRKSSVINGLTLIEEDIKLIDKHANDKDEIGMCLESSAVFIKRIIELQNVLEKQKMELIKHNLSLEGEVGVKTKTVYELQNTILRTIAELVECRDSITGGHIERTQHYLLMLINYLLKSGVYVNEISSWNIDLLVMSSQLHDVGKISIKDEILMKPGKLTDEEFVEMKKHTVYGVDIIGKIAENTEENDFLQYAEIMAGSHHEKWDGTGYPLGLKGNKIPLQGRLMALIDVYDALTNDRPYKIALSHEEAVEIIRQGSGTHFDPLIDGIFLLHESTFKDGVHGDSYVTLDINFKNTRSLNPALKVIADVISSRSSAEVGYTERMKRCLEIFINALLKSDDYKEEVSGWDMDVFLISAQLHDVGKIAVADSLLNKTEKLTDEEFENVKSHVDFGVKIIRQIRVEMESGGNDNVMSHAEAMVCSHHEKWDGTGYPFGFKGNEIPLQGRMMAIVDVYNALTTERPHRKMLSHSEAAGIIKKGSGTHFDPNLVEVFIKYEKDFEKAVTQVVM